MMGALVLCAVGRGIVAQDKKKSEKKALPRIVVVVPLGAAPGKSTMLTIRGSSLDKATEVKVSGGKAKIVSKGPAPVPDKNPEKVGDTQVVAEVTLDEKLPDPAPTLVLITPD